MHHARSAVNFLGVSSNEVGEVGTLFFCLPITTASYRPLDTSRSPALQLVPFFAVSLFSPATASFFETIPGAGRNPIRSIGSNDRDISIIFTL